MAQDQETTGQGGDSERLPKHQLIFQTLRAEILGGKYAARGRLPSETQLLRRFGTSRTTVSHALRDLKYAGLLERRRGSGTYITEATRPSSGYFGMIIPGHGHTEIFAPICAEIARRSQLAGYTLLWGHSSSSDLETRAQQALELCANFARQNVAGVFLEPLEHIPGREAINQEIIRTLTAHRIPVVLLDRDFVSFPERSAYDLIGIDNLAAGYRLADHLLRLGARRITFISRPGAAPTGLQRIAGIQDAFLNAGIPWGADQIAYGNPEDADFVRGIAGDSPEKRPDAIICSNDATAARLLKTLRQLSTRVPEDVRLASFDDLEYAKLLSPALTTIHQPCEQLGAAAVQALLQRIREPDTPTREILLDAPLVVRQSCGAAAVSYNVCDVSEPCE